MPRTASGRMPCAADRPQARARVRARSDPDAATTPCRTQMCAFPSTARGPTVAPQGSEHHPGLRKPQPRDPSLAHFASLRFGSRMRFGKRSSSREIPTRSCLASARSANRSAIPRTNKTVAYAPAEAPGSPFSTRPSVMRLMSARSAKSAVGIRRRRCASRRSAPSFRSARTTGSGRFPCDCFLIQLPSDVLDRKLIYGIEY